MGALTKIFGTNPEIEHKKITLKNGDFVVMVTDGVLEYLQVEDAVEMLRQLIEELADTDAVTFARKIIERVLLFTGGTAADDMTVLVLKALER